jgi:DNA-binding Lrp family transcriptional regulator
MTKAYVLVVTDSAAMRRVAAALREVEGVTQVHEVMGPYDVVAELEAESVTEIPAVLADTIRTIEGIQSTTTLVAFPAP